MERSSRAELTVGKNEIVVIEGDIKALGDAKELSSIDIGVVAHDPTGPRVGR